MPSPWPALMQPEGQAAARNCRRAQVVVFEITFPSPFSPYVLKALQFLPVIRPISALMNAATK